MIQKIQRFKFEASWFVIIAAFLWSTDVLVRRLSMDYAHPFLFIYMEHLLGVVLLLLWLIVSKKPFLSLTKSQWIAGCVSGVAGSALAMVFLSAALEHINPNIAVLLQKLQPIFVTLLAYWFLKEKPNKNFYPLSCIAVLAAIFLAFPEMQFNFIQESASIKGICYALIACLLWALSTVTGKILNTHPSAVVTTFWRFLFGWICLSIQCLIFHPLSFSDAVQSLQSPAVLYGGLYLTFIPGILAMLFYYKGLGKVSATTSGFLELLSPVCACVLNIVFLKAPLNFVQMIAGIILLFSIWKITLL